MIRVCFTKPMAPYNSGEFATFDEARARQLIEQGFATMAVVKADVTDPKERQKQGLEPIPDFHAEAIDRGGTVDTFSGSGVVTKSPDFERSGPIAPESRPPSEKVVEGLSKESVFGKKADAKVAKDEAKTEAKK